MAKKYFMFKRKRAVPNELTRKGLAIEEFEDGPVSVMASKDGYTMVRYKGCIPFVIRTTDITREV